MRKLFLFALLLLAGIPFSNAQLVITSGGGAAAVSAAVGGSGLTISNVTINCNAVSYGSFSGGASSGMGVSNGLVLTTGNASTLPGTGNSNDDFSYCVGTTSTDPQLASVIGGASINDPCIIEFDVVPACNNIQLVFVFGSDEYTNWVSAGFNDAFGFFVSGPNPAGGSYTNQNIAVLPSGTVVSIDNVNGTTNSSYFHDNNAGGSANHFDGFTNVLSPAINVTPCATYHFKLAIADASDCAVDSGVLIDIIQCSAPWTVAMASTPTGCGAPSGTATATVTGGIGPFTYSWAPSGGTGSSATGLAAGTYTCTVNDGLSCTPAQTYTVTVGSSGTPSTVTVPASQTVCNGTVIAASSYTSTPAGGTFTWTNSNTAIGLAASGTGNQPSFTATNTGTTNISGTITVTPTVSGCVGTPNTYTITVKPTPNVVVPANITVCAGGTVAASAYTSNVAGTTFAWTNSNAAIGLAASGTGNTPSFTATNAGTTPITSTITVTPTATGCPGTPQTYTITVNPKPGVTVPANITVCNGGAVAASSFTSGVAGTTFAWTNSNTAIGLAASGTGNTPAFTATNTGTAPITATITVTPTASGCPGTPSTYTITVNPTPAVTVPANSTLCAGASVPAATFTSAVTGTIFAWTNSNTAIGLAASGTGNIASFTATNATASPITSTITVTPTANGCPGTPVSYTITVNPIPVITVNSPSICPGSSATLTATGGTTYSWNTGSTSNPLTVSPASTTTYTVTGTTAGCSSTAVATVTVGATMTVTVNSPTICAGQTATLTATGGTTYTWNTGSTANPLTVSPATTTSYTVTGVTGGCSGTAVSTVTVNPVPVVTVNSPTICAGSSATLTAAGAGSYSWSTGSTSNPLTVSPATTTSYTVTGTTTGCSATAVSTVTVNPIPVITVNSTTICPGSSATLTATGGTTYSWDTGSTNNPLTVSPATTTSYTVTGTTAGCSSTAVATVTVNTALTVNAGVDATICYGASTSLSATPNGAGYTYAWTPATGLSSSSIYNPTANPTATTTYTVTITDALGCTGSDNVQVTVDPQLTLAIAGIPATCNGASTGQTIVIPGGGTSPYTYSWSSGCTGASCTGLPAGPYSVTVTDALGCVADTNTTVTEPTAITLSTSAVTAHCNLPDGSATVTATGGTPGYTYLWDNGQTTATATGLVPASYCVTVTDANGCTANICVTVPNAAGVIPSIASQTAVSCNGLCDGTATATATGGVTPYTYSWNTTPVQTTATASGLCAGTYTVTVTDASGCADITTVTITQPTAVVTAPITNVTICNGGTTTLTASASGGNGAPYTYNWTPAGTGTTAAVTVTPATTTVYTVTAADANGCAAPPVSVTVTVNPPLSVNAAGAISICPGASANISATAINGNGGPYTYSWAPAGTGSTAAVTVTPGTTTTYTVTANDGCSPAVTDTVTVTILPLPVVNFTVDNNAGCAPVCVNFTDNSTATGSTITTWNWTFGDGSTANTQNPSHCFANAGDYDVTLAVVSAAGCTSTFINDTMIHVYPMPTASFTAPLSTSIMNPLVQFSNNSINAATFVWDFGDPASTTNTSTLPNPNHTYPDVGTYCVTLAVTSANGCTDTSSLCVVIDPEFSFYIPNAFSPNGDGINDEFFGKGDYIKTYEMYIYDRWGNMIFYTDDINLHWDGKANHGSEIAQQDVYVYVVKLTDNKDKKHKYIGSVTLVK